MRVFPLLAVAVATCAAAAPAADAATPRELLTQASFGTADKQAALVRIEAAHASATAALKREPNDREAAMMQATAIGYRAKLTGSRAEALAARKQFEALSTQAKTLAGIASRTAQEATAPVREALDATLRRAS